MLARLQDLKSANILLARDFTAKIADVGLARILHDDVLSTRREVGTFAWAAPEVLLGQRCTEAADIYSVSGWNFPDVEAAGSAGCDGDPPQLKMVLEPMNCSRKMHAPLRQRLYWCHGLETAHNRFKLNMCRACCAVWGVAA